MDVIKKESYHPLYMRNEQNGDASVRGNREDIGYAFPHWSVIITQNNRTSLVEYIPPTQPLRNTEV